MTSDVRIDVRLELEQIGRARDYSGDDHMNNQGAYYNSLFFFSAIPWKRFNIDNY